MKVLLTGATGLIGREVGKELVRRGHQVLALSRNQKNAGLNLPFPCEIIEGDLTHQFLQPQALREVEAVIHLAGENVGDGKWTEERKAKIFASRVDFTRHLIKALPETFQVFISASAIGFYGDRGSETLTEKSVKGQGFLADVCEQWEHAVWDAKRKAPQARFAVFRTGVVLSRYGGALSKMLLPFQSGVGGVLGTGQQWMSWIHLQDLVQMYVTALEDSKWSGIFNVVAPEPVTNVQFTDGVTQTLGVRKGPAVPQIALKTLYGEMSSVLFDSQKVKSTALPKFEFLFPNLASALKDCLEPYRGGNSVFYSEQFLPWPRAKVFPFFALAENLETITPPLLSFRIEKMSTAKIEKGTLIDYRLKIHGVPVRWQTEISQWNPEEAFVDRQLKGPYRKWEHTHRFEDFAGGTLMTDEVRFQVPLGILGRVVSGSFVRGDIEKIFSFRREKVPELLKQMGSPSKPKDLNV